MMREAGAAGRSPRRPAGSGQRAPRLVFVALGIGFATLVLFALIRSLDEAPARQLRTELPGIGTILVTVHLEPDPPRVGGNRVHLQVREVRGAPVTGVSVAATVGSARGALRPATLQSLGAGAHEGVVGFPDVGEWWLEVEISRDSGAARLRFPVEVRGNL